jgi:gamma-glutamyltranspeptidase/glutathione hydrolase
MTDTPHFDRAAVTAPHREAALTGRAILEEGGNALEAAIAVSAVLSVVMPQANGLGGDAIWLIREPRGRVRALLACGPGSVQQNERAPLRGAAAARTLPGLVAGWILARDMAQAFGGRTPLATLLGPAVALAKGGCPVAPTQAREVPGDLADLASVPGFAEAFMSEGGVKKAKAAQSFPALGAMLDHLTHAGLPDFYSGDVAREITADCENLSIGMTRAELADCRASESDAPVLGFARQRFYAAGAFTRGKRDLWLAGLLSKLETPDSFALALAVIEAAKAAEGPGFIEKALTEPPKVLQERLAFLAGEIRLDRAAPWSGPPQDEAGTFFAVSDADGLMVACVQTLGLAYGAGLLLPRTGLLLSNRGALLQETTFGRSGRTTQPPLLMGSPMIWVDDRGAALACGVTGGGGPSLAQARLFTQIRADKRFSRGDGFLRALAEPRLARPPTGSASQLLAEEGCDSRLLEQLDRVGHEIIMAAAENPGFGQGGALLRASEGYVAAAQDPRGDGGAAGI